MIQEEKGTNHPIQTEAPEIKYYDWKDPTTGKIHQVPQGIQPGWDYNPGEAAWGKSEALRLMDDQGKWTDLNPKFPKDYDLPDSIPVDAPMAAIGPKAETEKDLRAALISVLQGETSKAFLDPAGGVTLVTDAIVDHILEDPENRWNGREMYFPFIPELIESPAEIWIGFARSDISGRVSIRKKYVKMVDLGRNKILGLWAEVEKGYWVSNGFFTGKKTGMNNLRKGRRLWKRQ